MMESTPFKKFMFNSFMALGKAGVRNRLSGEAPAALDRIKSGLAHVALMRALLDINSGAGSKFDPYWVGMLSDVIKLHKQHYQR